ncbi:MAG TPA: HEAT repeat domain-containing protein [Planctomycetota bacterium]|nr:HEAT repeat domain-containing protein [Planctomycetota bacterium]
MGVSDTFTYLAELPVEHRLPYVEAALREPYVELQSAAFDALSDPAGLNRPDLVIQHFPDLTADVRRKVADRGDQFVSVARDVLRSPKEWSRRSAYQVLAALRPREAVSILVRGLSDSSPVVRESVTDALEAIANRYYYHLVAARMHGDSESRRFIAENRATMMESLGPLLRAYPLHAKRVFIDTVIDSGDDAYSLVADILTTRSEPATVAAFIHALSTAQTEPAIELIFRLSLDPRPRLQDAAMDALKLRRDPGFPALLATVLSRMIPEKFESLARHTKELLWWPMVENAVDVDAFTAGKLMEFISLSGLEPSRRNEVLLHFAASPHPEVRARLLLTLQAISYPQLLELARSFIEDPSDEVKLAAARIIIGLNPPHKARMLMPLLNSPSEELRRMATREVASASFDKYLRSFERLDPETREAAARALAKIDTRIVDRLAEELTALDPERRLRALRVIDYVDAETDLRQNLMALLNDPDRRVRATALKIVQLTESVEGMRLLVGALSDPDKRVRANAIEAFEDGGDPRVVPVLMPFLRDEDNRVRANTAKALWNLGSPEGRATLEQMLNDADEMMRLSAVWATGEVKFPGAMDLLLARIESDPSPAVRLKISEVLSRASGKEAPAP